MGKKKVLVSACLLGRNCKYDGGNNYSEALVRYLKEKAVEVMEVCPEVEGGLPVPRVPVELVDGGRECGCMFPCGSKGGA